MYKYIHKIIYWLKDFNKVYNIYKRTYRCLQQFVDYKYCFVLRNTINTNAWFTISTLQQEIDS